MRAGKPVMKLGSHTESEQALDRRKVNDNSGLSSRTSSVPNWYGESAVSNIAGEIEKEKIHFTKDIKHLEHDLEKQERPTFSLGSGEGRIKTSEQPTRGILKNSSSEQAISRL
ncbi:hypothetical protein FSP39_007035 [Pinctada imbricata]|uniref:Uncharacterized protein n=1 Tax=Pinctada imbricata TaxID=66713 RepID=A0AA89BPL4_PINIB|nr:hypothetical protein FSP39_007035 [Pinctada imbricata]